MKERSAGAGTAGCAFEGGGSFGDNVGQWRSSAAERPTLFRFLRECTGQEDQSKVTRADLEHEVGVEYHSKSRTDH